MKDNFKAIFNEPIYWGMTLYERLKYYKIPAFSLILINENELKFDGVKGTAEVMKYAITNKHHRTAEEIQAVADEINNELGRFDPLRRHQFQIELPFEMFASYLYESQGIKLSIPYNQID